MRRSLLPAAVLLAVLSASCGPAADDSEGGVPSSTTAMEVADGVELQFRTMSGPDGAEDTDMCLQRHPETGGVGLNAEAAPDEPVTACAAFKRYEGSLWEVEFAPAFLTEEHVEYVDYDYGTAGLATVYVVLDEEGVEAWKASAGESFGSAQMFVDGRPFLVPIMELSPNDIVNIGGLGSIEEAESIADTIANGFDDAG